MAADTGGSIYTYSASLVVRAVSPSGVDGWSARVRLVISGRHWSRGDRRPGRRFLRCCR
jgi:hypothetical protein